MPVGSRVRDTPNKKIGMTIFSHPFAFVVWGEWGIWVVWVIMGSKFLWVLMGSYGFLWVLVGLATLAPYVTYNNLQKPITSPLYLLSPVSP